MHHIMKQTQYIGMCVSTFMQPNGSKSNRLVLSDYRLEFFFVAPQKHIHYSQMWQSQWSTIYIQLAFRPISSFDYYILRTMT